MGRLLAANTGSIEESLEGERKDEHGVVGVVGGEGFECEGAQRGPRRRVRIVHYYCSTKQQGLEAFARRSTHVTAEAISLMWNADFHSTRSREHRHGEWPRDN